MTGLPVGGRVVIAGALVACAVGARAHAAPFKVAAELEAAGEVDSNPHREGEGGAQPIEAAGVAKTGGRLRVSGRAGRVHVHFTAPPK